MATNERQIRSEFKTREGFYRNIRQSEYCRPTRLPLSGKELLAVHLSFVSCKDQDGRPHEWLLFNSGKELYFYLFEGVGKIPDLRKHVDKRMYKPSSLPACHDFNLVTRTVTSLHLVVGFTGGFIQYCDPVGKQLSSTFNNDPQLDSSNVTCIKWVPGTENQFISSHRSGQLFVWTTDCLPKCVPPQSYVLHKEIQDTVIYTPKPRHHSPILFKWKVGYGAICSFAFSPDLRHMAVVNQDGFLRVYDYQNQSLVSRMRSYYGSLLCVCWSPDGEYVATGGEDDQISVWSFRHQCVVARGVGHRSYITALAFDPYTTVLPEAPKSTEAETTNHGEGGHKLPPADSQKVTQPPAGGTSEEGTPPCDNVAYRLGSVGQDGMLCFWDLSEDVLRLRRSYSRGRSRVSRLLQAGSQPSSPSLPQKVPHQESGGSVQPSASDKSGTSQMDLPLSNNLLPDVSDKGVEIINGNVEASSPEKTSTSDSTGQSSRGSNTPHSDLVQSESPSKPNPKKTKKKLERVAKLKERLRGVMKNVVSSNYNYNHQKEIGTFETCRSDDVALKMHEVNVIEPLIAKYISQERLTELVFLDDCFVVCSQDGFVNTWARPDTPLPKECVSNIQRSDTTSIVYNSPGLNSPRPGDHEEPEKIKQTSV